MAFIDQSRKAALAPKVKAVLRKYGLKGSLRVSNYTSLRLTVQSGDLDFIGNAVAFLVSQAKMWQHDMNMLNAAEYIAKDQTLDVNIYHPDRGLTGKCLDAVRELIDAMNYGNHDNSDIQTDYFDVGWYVHLHIGKWDNPYKYTGV